MSRIGRVPVLIPEKVNIDIQGNLVTVKGPLGELKQTYNDRLIGLAIEDNQVVVTKKNDSKQVKALHGLYRSLINNMVVGVTQGFSKKLIINGVGYKAELKGKTLVLNLGYSHKIEMEAPEGITFEVPKITEIVVKGIDKHLVGQVAANIKAFRKVEPYHGYGVRYENEYVARKEGKTAGK